MAGLFDEQSEIYALSRPRYPPELFSFLASHTRNHIKAWDVGTGNGQSASMLADYFDTVIATDVSKQQLEHAIKRPNITYAVASEKMSFEDLSAIIGPQHSVDLITVAQALHWFDLDLFYSHVRRFLKPGGLIAAWTYILPHVSDEIDDLIKEFYEKKTGPYWASQRAFVDEGYMTIYFPFDPIMDTAGVEFEWRADLHVEEFLLYLRSWSAVQTALNKGIVLLDEETNLQFAKAWGDGARAVTWPIKLLVGCVPFRD